LIPEERKEEEEEEEEKPQKKNFVEVTFTHTLKK